ncbi:hypothetical protein DFO47_11142 [Arthrobacter sp. AG258]|uniref:hypothetical protein n=1 Tax=Arthrobacter sp. AG258 TaxID=2183899 RepID=UPI0010DF4454|nr:hypothetical protein [Arthrobacter sp. AG258]TDT75702.1 hypothetical protein DFO47_11142 [Arthrobacter sp. AG258]
MDEHNTKPAPGTSGQNRQPAPVWGGSPEGSGHGAAAHDREFPANQGGEAYETVGQEQPSQGWGTPVEGPRSAGWGTPPATGQVHSGGTGWGAPQQYASTSASRGPKGAWTAKKGLLVGGAAVVLGAAAGAGAYAAGNGSGSAANAQGAGAVSQFGPGGQNGMAGPGSQAGTNGGTAGGMGMDGGPGGLGMGAAGLNAAIHSEYVILEGSNYVTMAGQAGTVTDVSATSLTVKSEDGFSRTYAVGSDVQVTQGMRQRGGTSTGSTLSLSNVTAGSSVRVTALKDGDTYTVQAIQLATAGSGTSAGAGTSSN